MANAPIQYIVQTADEAAWIPPQATADDHVMLLPVFSKLVANVVGPMGVSYLYSSWAKAQAALAAGVGPRVTEIGWGVEYNNPAEPLPIDEAANIPQWLTTAAQDCANYGKGFVVVPDNHYDGIYGAKIDAAATRRTFQVQRYQTDLTKVVANVTATAKNTHAKLFVQVYPGDVGNGGVDAAIAAWNAVKGIPGVTGVGFYSGNPTDWLAVQAAIAALRPS